MPNYQLYMMILGCRPEGRFTEQHDIFFGIAKKPGDLIPQIKNYWPQANGKIHIDALREVHFVDQYKIVVEEKNNGDLQTQSLKLFFLNLGGYKRDEFDEFHYKLLAVAPDKGDAVRQAKATAFYKHTGFPGATSHIDDKYGVDVDDVFEITDILSKEFTDRFSLRIETARETGTDEMELGYITMEKLTSRG